MCVDYNRATVDYVESLMFLFHVPSLSKEQLATVAVATTEVSEFRFCTLGEAHDLLSARVARRLSAALGGRSLP